MRRGTEAILWTRRNTWPITDEAGGAGAAAGAAADDPSAAWVLDAAGAPPNPDLAWMRGLAGAAGGVWAALGFMAYSNVPT
jgi:hypothetical protein